jgi:hypothetical protein
MGAVRKREDEMYNMLKKLGRKKARGQAVVETALMMVFFLVFLLALIDLGRAFFVMVAVQNAAGEGSLFGMGNPTCVNAGSGAGCEDPNNIEYRVRNESDNRLLDPSLFQITVSLDPLNPGHPGTMIEVEVIYPYKPILPMLSAFGASEIVIRRTAIQLIP